jgi:hypothetical protein
METKQLFTDLIKAQVELKNTPKDAQGHGYKYTDLATLIDVVKPVLAKNNLGFTQLVSDKEDKICVTTLLIHTSGESIATSLCMPLATLARSNNPVQQAGATITYARRYTLSSILGIASDEDTDAYIPPMNDTNKKQPVNIPPKQVTKPATKQKGNIEKIKEAIKGANSPEELQKIDDISKQREWTSSEQDEIVDMLEDAYREMTYNKE